MRYTHGWHNIVIIEKFSVIDLKIAASLNISLLCRKE